MAPRRSSIFTRATAAGLRARVAYAHRQRIAAALMAQQATGQAYDRLLRRLVYGPSEAAPDQLADQLLAPGPFVHGYDNTPGEENRGRQHCD